MKSRDIETLLPAVFRSTLRGDNPAKALLHVMEVLQQPSEEILGNVESYFDPRRAPDRFVPYLASWLDLDRFLRSDVEIRTAAVSSPVPVTQLREWIAAAVQISRWRGTAKGLRMLLETATGISGFEILEGTRSDGGARPFHLRVRAPRGAGVHRALIERIIDLEKPAYVTCDPLEFYPIPSASP
jgi:phage tail-like protein